MVSVSVFEGSDLDALQEHLRAINPGVNVRSSPAEGAFTVKSQIIEIGALKAWRNRYGRGLKIDSKVRLETLMLGIPAKGGLTTTHSAKPGQMLSFYGNDTDSLEIKPQTSCDYLAIPIATLSARLGQLLDRPIKGAVRLQPVIEAEEGGGAAVRAVVHGLLCAGADQATIRSGVAIRSLSNSVIDLVLESLPHNYSEALHRPPVRIGPRQVRRAMAYIRDHPMPMKTIDELAVICGVSVRSLQYTFREFVGMTPAEYWRRFRVERAIDQLRRNPSDSIAIVAAAWGFTNVTRFRALAGSQLT